MSGYLVTFAVMNNIYTLTEMELSKVIIYLGCCHIYLVNVFCKSDKGNQSKKRMHEKGTI